MEIIALLVALFAISFCIVSLVPSLEVKTKEEKEAKRVSKEYSYGKCFNCSMETILDHNGLCCKEKCVEKSESIDAE
jgi:hypothetical protein